MKQCPACGAGALPTDRFCAGCGASLAAAAAPCSWYHFVTAPRRLFSAGTPPGWLIAIILVLVVGLVGGLLNLAMDMAGRQALPSLLGNLDPKIAAILHDHYRQSAQGAGSVLLGGAIGMIIGLPLAVISYLVAASIYYGLARWQRGVGSWAVFTRWYALLELPQLIVVAAALPLTVALLMPRLPGLLLAAAAAPVALAGLGVWFWKCWLRYQLLAALLLPDRRAGGIVIGVEIARLVLVTAVIVGLAGLGLLVALFTTAAGLGG